MSPIVIREGKNKSNWQLESNLMSRDSVIVFTSCSEYEGKFFELPSGFTLVQSSMKLRLLEQLESDGEYFLGIEEAVVLLEHGSNSSSVDLHFQAADSDCTIINS